MTASISRTIAVCRPQAPRATREARPGGPSAVAPRSWATASSLRTRLVSRAERVLGGAKLPERAQIPLVPRLPLGHAVRGRLVLLDERVVGVAQLARASACSPRARRAASERGPDRLVVRPRAAWASRRPVSAWSFHSFRVRCSASVRVDASRSARRASWPAEAPRAFPCSPSCSARSVSYSRPSARRGGRGRPRRSRRRCGRRRAGTRRASR